MYYSLNHQWHSPANQTEGKAWCLLYGVGCINYINGAVTCKQTRRGGRGGLCFITEEACDV